MNHEGLTGFIAALGDIPYQTEPSLVRQKSRDFFWYSPVLKAQLENCVGDIVVTPRDERDVLDIARLCVAHRLPLTVRGAGTGNYGQAVPLQGGVVLDMAAMRQVGRITDGVVTVQPGAKLKDIEDRTIPQGWELRLYPSTRRTATIGGFVAGGSTGIGAINFGLLADGCIRRLRVVTLEADPQVIEVTGAAVNHVHHAYGTNGIITEIDLPLAPAKDWIDIAVAFEDFAALATFCQQICEQDAVQKKLVAAVAWPIPDYFRTLAAEIPKGSAVGLFMIGEGSQSLFAGLLEAAGGKMIYQASQKEVEASRQVPIYEYSWNHTTLQALKLNRGVTYLQTLFAGPDHLANIAAMMALFPDELSMHIEFVRLDGQICCFGIQIVNFTTEQRLAEIIAIHEAHGHKIFNPHTYVLEDGGMKQTDPDQLAFKRRADPFGLLNPGKMRGWDMLISGAA